MPDFPIFFCWWQEIFDDDKWQVDFFPGDDPGLLNGPNDLFMLSGEGQWTPQNSNPNPNLVPEPSTMLY